MATIREIREITSDTITLTVPEELRHQKVEITIRPVRKRVSRNLGVENGWPAGFFERYVGSVPDFPDIDFEGDYEVREPLE